MHFHEKKIETKLPSFSWNLGLNGSFVKEVQEFVKKLFLTGQTDLQSRNDYEQPREKDENTGKKLLNRFKLTVLANAVCVDILVWATKDENGMMLLIVYIFFPEYLIYTFGTKYDPQKTARHVHDMG